MLKSPALFIAALFLFSCGDKNEQSNKTNHSDSTAIDSIAIINDPKNNLTVQTNSFSEVDSSGIIIFPLSMGETGRDGSSLSYKEFPTSSYWNLIFYNSKTAVYRLLSERKMLISGFDIKYKSGNFADISYTNRQIFYRVTVEDYNKDKKLTADDPVYLFVSDKEGNYFRQISPDGCHLKSWELIKASNNILMIVSKDTDKNKKFEDTDEVASFQIDINKENQPSEIFSTAFKNKLKVMYDKDWKKIKE